MIKHFVTFFSPGTFVAETTTQEIEAWDIAEATKRSRLIKERHGATPYGFQFTTRRRGEKDFDSKEVNRSGMYYLGGETLTIKNLEKEDAQKNRTLISNMRCNGWKKVVRNDNSWRWVQPLNAGDTVLKQGGIP